MIEPIDDGFNVICDGCGEEENFRGLDFLEVIQKIKDLGWHIVKNGDEWEYYCRRCAAKDY